ncbi:MAG: flagellar motor switch protein FliM [Phycisphaerales bacterium]|nr:flagellar motor switch protein FliM [Phycisphaerales bacterium]
MTWKRPDPAGTAMADVLEQSDIDSLIAAAAAVATSPAEEAATEAPKVFSHSRRGNDPVEILSYDFKRPERVSKDQMRALQTLHEAFARNFGASLSGFLRTIVEVKVASCEQMTYSEFVAGLPNPTSFNLVGAEGLEGQMCLEVSPLIIYPIIDRLLGGNSQELFIPQRPLTLIETRLITNVTKRGLTALAEAWTGLGTFQFAINASESNPQLVQIVPPNEVVVVIGFELRLGNRAGTMNLCIPFNVIEPFMERLSSQTWFAAAKQQAAPDVERRISRTLSAAPVEITGTLEMTTITIQELLQLAVGDVITTDHPVSRPILVHVEGERKYSGQLGQYRGNKALRILGPASGPAPGR